MKSASIARRGSALALARLRRRRAATSGGGGGGEAPAETLTIYSSLPLQGAARAQSEAAVNGAKLALEQAGGKAGQVPDQVRLARRLHRAGGGWEPNATSDQRAQGRRRRLDDRLHRRVQLGRDRGLAADPQRGRHRAGQPGQHRRRHHLRRPRRRARRAGQVLPDRRAHLRPRAARRTPTRAPRWPRWPRRRAAPRPTSSTTRRSTARAWPRTSSSRPRRSAWRSRATRASTRTPPTTARSRRRSRRPARSASSTAASRPTTRSRSSRTWPSRCPTRRCSGPEGVGETGFFDPKDGGLPADVAKRVLITIPGVAPEEYPPAGKEFLKAYTAKYGEENPDRYAVYGYESMSLLLDAIKRAGDDGNDRAGRGQAAAGDQGPRGRVRQVLDRPERRHHAHAVRHLPDRGRRAGLRPHRPGDALTPT